MSEMFRHVDDDEGRTLELQQSTVKCMRGILFFYMQQANKVNVKKDASVVMQRVASDPHISHI